MPPIPNKFEVNGQILSKLLLFNPTKYQKLLNSSKIGKAYALNNVPYQYTKVIKFF